jgi:hypothetical protein
MYGSLLNRLGNKDLTPFFGKAKVMENRKSKNFNGNFIAQPQSKNDDSTDIGVYYDK